MLKVTITEMMTMGLSAMQARLQMIVSQMNANALNQSRISQAQSDLAMQSEVIAKEYNEKMSDTKIVINVVKDGDTFATETVDLDYNTMSSQGFLALTQKNEILLKKDDNGEWIIPQDYEGNPLIEIKDGKAVILNDKSAQEYFIKDGSKYLDDKDSLNAAINYGALYLLNTNNLDVGKIGIGNLPQSGNLESILDTSNDAEAQSTYQYEMARIERIENQYDQDLKKLETEITALSKEYDSLRDGIKENIDRTFEYSGK